MNEIVFPEAKQLKAMKLQPNLLKFEFDGATDNSEFKEQSDLVKASIQSFRYLNDNVVEIALDSKLEFQVGDAIGVYPKNPEEIVNEVIENLEIAQTSFQVSGEKIPKHLKHKLVKDALFDIDFYTFPTKSYFRGLAEFATEKSKQHLLFISSIAGKAVYQQMQKLRPSLLSLFKFFQVKPTLEFVLEHSPSIQSRYYSCSQKSDYFTFAFNVVKIGDFKGLCTNWLVDVCEQKATLDIYLRKSPVAFSLPKEGSPILIGNGTGIAPFIGFVQQLASEQRTCTLVYGHRTSKDGIYMDVINQNKDNGTIDFVECLSRQESEFKYVQDSLGSINDLFTRPIMVCGSIAMGKGVHEKLIELYCETAGVSKVEAVEFWQQRGKEGLYLRELWG